LARPQWSKLPETLRARQSRLRCGAEELIKTAHKMAAKQADARGHVRSVQALVRWRELAHCAASRRFAVGLSTRLWHHANDYGRRRQHAGAPLTWVSLRHPEIMGRFGAVDIGVFPGETVGSVQAYAMGLLACDKMINARAANWTCARMRRVCACAHACDGYLRMQVLVHV